MMIMDIFNEVYELFWSRDVQAVNIRKIVVAMGLPIAPLEKT
jgi:hypothetical protein